jgi:hypothetical protein
VVKAQHFRQHFRQHFAAAQARLQANRVGTSAFHRISPQNALRLLSGGFLKLGRARKSPQPSCLDSLPEGEQALALGRQDRCAVVSAHRSRG